MYIIDEQDRVVKLPEVPPPSAGAALPVVIATELHVGLAYLVAEHEPDRDEAGVRAVALGARYGAIVLVTFHAPRVHMFAGPNAQALSDHPLAARGLQPHAASEVVNSSWARLLERKNQARPSHLLERLEGLRHFVFTFRGSAFECVATHLSFDMLDGTLASIAPEMLHRVGLEASS